MLSIGLLLSSVLFFSCNNKFEEIIDAVDYNTFPSVSADNIEIVRTDSGKIGLKIFAPIYQSYSELEEDPHDMYSKGIKVITYSDYPIASSSLTCNYARHDLKEDLWEAKDDVIAVNITNDTLRTEQMFWDSKKEIIFSDKAVSIKTSTEIIYGTGFTAKQDFTGWKINKVKGTIYFKE